MSHGQHSCRNTKSEIVGSVIFGSREWARRAKAKLPPLTEAEFRRWRSQLGIAGSVAVGVGTNLRLQPNRYASLSQGGSKNRAMRSDVY